MPKSEIRSKRERTNEHVAELVERAKLNSWNEFIRDMAVPGELTPALLSGRTQLMPKGRPLSAEECQTLYDMIAVFMDTNAALREHAEQLAILVKEWQTQFQGVWNRAQLLQNFAMFKETEGETENV